MPAAQPAMTSQGNNVTKRKQTAADIRRSELLPEELVNVPSKVKLHPESRQRADERFLELLDKTFEKIRDFTNKRFSLLETDQTAFRGQVDAVMADLKSSNRHNSKKVLRKALREHYQHVTLLIDYIVINLEGFRKIIKKYDKALGSQLTSQYYPGLEQGEMHSLTEKLGMLQSECHSIYVFFSDSSMSLRDAATELNKALRMRKNEYTISGVMRTGVVLGALITVFFQIIYEFTRFGDVIGESTTTTLALLYTRFFGGMICLFLLFPVNVHVWQKARVNYSFIFHLDARTRLLAFEYLEMASLLSLVLMIGLLTYLRLDVAKQSGEEYIFDPLLPLFVASGIIVLMVANPFKMWFYAARGYFWKVVRRTFMAPFAHVRFADFWFADQLTSVAHFIMQSQYALCINDINTADCRGDVVHVLFPLSMIPSWIRFAQCLRRFRDDGYHGIHPHLTNALKYFGSLVVVAVAWIDTTVTDGASGSRGTWITLSIMSSAYKLWWDLYMDWGLLRKGVDHVLLRKRLQYRRAWLYYAAAANNIFLRFLWTFGLWFPKSVGMNANYWLTFVAFAEVIRRFVWNFFRVENEHVNNVGHFRVTREIPLPYAAKTGFMMEYDLGHADDDGHSESNSSAAHDSSGSHSSSEGSDGENGNLHQEDGGPPVPDPHVRSPAEITGSVGTGTGTGSELTTVPFPPPSVRPGQLVTTKEQMASPRPRFASEGPSAVHNNSIRQKQTVPLASPYGTTDKTE
eukprot:TRINITY_DN737_c0_g1_i3.p1 TRINITY_DN737_c0_g1~~TRINITY_DN737_c0_g1_i3.p1  ORF type:complete len:744 (-),score=132.56 TRINITY_DN737_c0_g1_i3:42-2273(-)